MTSTAVRALTELLPERDEVVGCIFGCDPDEESTMCEWCIEKKRAEGKLERRKSKMKVIELPVNATEDRVIGTMDIEHAIKTGEKKFEPGILAHANRNILYVDEVNLLDDHIVDILLDVAAMGINTIEREGISFSHPSRFILVGTMNPEEGDLRPQLLDRFGLVVDVTGEKDPSARAEVIKRRLQYERDPEGFAEFYLEEQRKLCERIEKAKKLLPEVSCSDEIFETAAKVAIALDVDGHRADICMVKTAMTIAAYNNRKSVTAEDLLKAALLVLPHRIRKKPLEDSVFDIDQIEELIYSNVIG